MGQPEALLGLVLFGSARPENRPTGCAWAVRQTRWPMEARPGGTWAIRARALSSRAVPARADPLIIFRQIIRLHLKNTVNLTLTKTVGPSLTQALNIRHDHV